MAEGHRTDCPHYDPLRDPVSASTCTDSSVALTLRLVEGLRELINDVRKINDSPGANIGIDRLSNPIEQRLREAESLLREAGAETKEKV